jgi:adenylate kinase family enzyme
MNCLNVFLLGRPGCGKSEIFRRITAKLSQEKICNDFLRVDDFPKLWNIFQEDEKTGEWKRCRKTPDGGYLVTDNSIWDEILRQVDKDVSDLQKDDRVVFIEFSRPNYTESMKNFSKKILDNAIIIYSDCSFETCWGRNVARHKAAVACGTDDHLVSREEMEKTYLHDDKSELLQKSKIPVLVVDTDAPGIDHLIPKIEKIMVEIKKVINQEVTDESNC